MASGLADKFNKTTDVAMRRVKGMVRFRFVLSNFRLYLYLSWCTVALQASWGRITIVA